MRDVLREINHPCFAKKTVFIADGNQHWGEGEDWLFQLKIKQFFLRLIGDDLSRVITLLSRLKTRFFLQNNYSWTIKNGSRLFGKKTDISHFASKEYFSSYLTKLSLLDKKKLFAMFTVNNGHRCLEEHNFVSLSSNENKKQPVIQHLREDLLSSKICGLSIFCHFC